MIVLNFTSNQTEKNNCPSLITVEGHCVYVVSRPEWKIPIIVSSNSHIPATENIFISIIHFHTIDDMTKIRKSVLFIKYIETHLLDVCTHQELVLSSPVSDAKTVLYSKYNSNIIPFLEKIKTFQKTKIELLEFKVNIKK